MQDAVAVSAGSNESSLRITLQEPAFGCLIQGGGSFKAD